MQVMREEEREGQYHKTYRQAQDKHTHTHAHTHLRIIGLVANEHLVVVLPLSLSSTHELTRTAAKTHAESSSNTQRRMQSITRNRMKMQQDTAGQTKLKPNNNNE